MSKPSPIVLSTRYYLDHFHEMLDFVVSQYDHVLASPERKFIEDFSNLSLDGKSLYVRVANRKGYAFHRESLRYDEIHSIRESLGELKDRDFIRPPSPNDLPELLALLKRPQLVKKIRECASSDALASFPVSKAKKAELTHFALRNLDFETCFSPNDRQPFFIQSRSDEIDFLLFLFFGRLDTNLTGFALRDMGLVKTNAFKDEFKARFESAKEARAHFFYQQVKGEIETSDREALLTLSHSVPDWPKPDEHSAKILRHRVLYKLGRELERREEAPAALHVYDQSQTFPSSERQARLLYQLGKREEASALLCRMIDEPSCDEELLFAEDFFQRKYRQQRTGRLTRLLREAPVLQLDESNRDRTEFAVARKLTKNGTPAFHTENAIWQQLFGLMFWDLLFEGDEAALHNSFERLPLDLHNGTFYEKKQAKIEERLTLTKPSSDTGAFIKTVWEKNRGTANGVLPWYEDLFLLTCELVRLAPPAGLQKMLIAMAKDYRNLRSGFPDLMVIDDESIRFVEVKAEGDQIQRHQLVQIERLQAAGFSVAVNRVEWIVDPEQDYVVVDIETTGGNPKWNRVTEIGAVRVRGGKIIEQWSSLINPERRIPKRIVELTGITDEMVSTAPVFAEIADEFREFVGSAVFVAHRVSFDYGFLREEFRRLEEDFRCPTLCTVVASRKLFPGLSSYGLANLCREFSISLDSHHRALCDAKATAEILLKINAKRETVTARYDNSTAAID